MTVESLKAGTGSETGEVLKIGFSDGSQLSLKIPYLPDEYRESEYFFPGKELSDPEERALRFAAACYRAERAALRLVARAEQTCRGTSLKLQRRGHPAPPVAAVISRLMSLEILSDERYAVRWLRSRLGRSGESPLRLLAGLRRRGIAAAAAQEALHSVLDFETELALLKGYLTGRAYGRACGPNGRAYGLKREGFSGPVIAHLLEAEDAAAEGEP
ncbi:MAG: RecX family transcriptional regulator [Spirochaetaceae bacterium]|jgi:regulatory protein|nr:RecX family transcriptional regulator [Spirochaetaceae bacterium]